MVRVSLCVLVLGIGSGAALAQGPGMMPQQNGQNIQAQLIEQLQQIQSQNAQLAARLKEMKREQAQVKAAARKALQEELEARASVPKVSPTLPATHILKPTLDPIPLAQNATALGLWLVAGVKNDMKSRDTMLDHGHVILVRDDLAVTVIDKSEYGRSATVRIAEGSMAGREFTTDLKYLTTPAK